MGDLTNLLGEVAKENFVISNDERERLIEILRFVGVLLEKGSLWFNDKGIENNRQFFELCYNLADRFEKMPVFKEH
jgi:hypothetical protein